MNFSIQLGFLWLPQTLSMRKQKQLITKTKFNDSKTSKESLVKEIMTQSSKEQALKDCIALQTSATCFVTDASLS
jgi:hypothetical protein